MRINHDDKMRIIWILLVMAMLALTVIMSSGCKILKHKLSEKTDTTTLHKSALHIKDSTTSGNVKKEDLKISEQSEWYRMTLKYLAENRGDTTINNFYPQPTTVIYEGGKGKRDEVKTSIDSSYYNNIMQMMYLTVDSLSRKIERLEKTKHSETKGVGLITVILIALGATVGSGIIKHAFSNYTIIKKPS